MHNFRALKKRMINSRRDSQKVDEDAIRIAVRKNKLLSTTLLPQLNSQVHSMTADNYKITKSAPVQSIAFDNKSDPSTTQPSDSDRTDSLSQRIRLVKERLIRLSTSECIEEEDSQSFNEFALADSPSNIKFRRINVNESFDNTFLTEEFSGGEEEGETRANIVHLFSEEKEQCSETPLSKISEVSQEYSSNAVQGRREQSEYSKGRKEESLESLEYKRIFYMLETTEKGKKGQGKISEKDKAKRKPLEDIVNLLQNKYKKKLNFEQLRKKPFY